MASAHSGAASVSAHSQNPIRNIVPPSFASRAESRVGVRIPDMATIEMQSALPRLDDDKDVGNLLQHTVRRDEQPDIAFTGTLLASAAPEFRAQLRWREYRVYETKGGNLVLSRIGRSVKGDERDRFEAKVYKRAAALLVDDGGNYRAEGDSVLADTKSRAEVLTGYFGFDELAKELYRKLGVKTETTID
jgi:hypothetical protein